MGQPYVRKAVAWLLSRQNPDGGWGESCFTYDDPRTGGMGKSTASQTAWALLGLLHAGEAASPAVARGVQFLLSTQRPDGFWDESEFTGTGFPRVFYLRYHGYRAYFPLWALALYRRTRVQNGAGSPSTVTPLRFPRPPR
jgi:squalene-hopene/tetraprenyl-beta-curcumene cyclase